MPGTDQKRARSDNMETRAQVPIDGSGPDGPTTISSMLSSKEDIHAVASLKDAITSVPGRSGVAK